MPFSYALIPIVGAAIGWVTNLLAIKLLFRPLQPIRLGPFTIHGLIPKRRSEIALALAQTVATDLIDVKEILSTVATAEVRAEMTSTIMRVVEERGKERMPLFIPESIRIMLLEFLRKIVSEELTANLPTLLDEMTETMQDKVDIQAMVKERIEAMDLVELEEVILRLARTELKAIEYLGGILGFAIGLVQLGFILLSI